MESLLGKPAPVFESLDQDGNKISLASFIGKKIVLFFYPADDTTTCTVEACNLRDNFAQLRQLGIEVIGVSADDSNSHKHFEQKFGLPFRMVADTDKIIVNLYGVWGEKSMFGNKYMGIHRRTFLINEAGIIEHIILKVTSKTHSEQILKVWGLGARKTVQKKKA
jgi:thioredoxin-dependent peroxiredoxin